MAHKRTESKREKRANEKANEKGKRKRQRRKANENGKCEVAKRRFEQTKGKMKELKMEVEDITVLNLGYIEMNIKANYDYDRRIVSYEPNITHNDEIYDIYNPFMDIEIRKNNPKEEEKEIEK